VTRLKTPECVNLHSKSREQYHLLRYKDYQAITSTMTVRDFLFETAPLNRQRALERNTIERTQIANEMQPRTILSYAAGHVG